MLIKKLSSNLLIKRKFDVKFVNSKENLQPNLLIKRKFDVEFFNSKENLPPNLLMKFVYFMLKY